MQICERCGAEFPLTVVVNGERLDVRGRRRCLDCVPHRPQRKPRKSVPHEAKIKTCEACGQQFPAKMMIDGMIRSLYRRRFCLACSPFGIHNTSKTPPGISNPEELAEHRRKRRNAKTYRYQKKRRRQLKTVVVAALGGRCEDCGYRAAPAALDLHHRDPGAKEFAISKFNGSRTRLLAEVEKCVLLCANCHRLRHAAQALNAKGGAVVEFRRRMKARAVEHMGSTCSGCGRPGPQAIFEFHHLDPTQKEFGITQDGIPRRWEKVVAELAKCVMLCANCHREVHSGVREIDDGLLGLAETAGAYATRVA